MVHPLVFYAFNKHIYLIVHQECIKSIAESCKDAIDSRSFQETDEVKPEALPIYGAGERNVTQLLEAEEGHYVFNKDTLEEEVFGYMQTTNLAPMIQIKNNQIIGFTVSQVVQPKPLPPPPVKPKRTDFDKGKKGQPAYDTAIKAYERRKAQHEKAKSALKNSSADKKQITHRFSCNPNFLEGFPHEAVEQVCNAVNIPFHNQGLGTLALETSKETRVEVPVPMETKALLLEEQEGKCANPSCQAAIRQSCHCDHIKPRADGGSNKKDNLQLLCIECHMEKCAAEKEGGYGSVCPDYHSQFAPSVYQYVLPQIHSLAFVELTNAAVLPITKAISIGNERKEKIEATHFHIQWDTSGQQILDNITKGHIIFEEAIKQLEHLLEICQSREQACKLRNRLDFVKKSNTMQTCTLDGSITHQIEPKVQQMRKLGAEMKMKQTQLKQTYYTEEILKKMAGWQIDFKGQYPNLMRYRKEFWPKFSVMDAPKPFTGTLEPEKAGWYYVETMQTFPFRGCSWYPVATVKLGLEYHLIAFTDIKYEYIPSEVLAPDHFVPYLDRIEQAFEGLEGNFTTSNTKSTKEWNFTSLMKAVKCSLVGAFAQKDRHSEWVRATLSPATAANWTIMDGTDQECFVSQPLLSTDHKFNQIYIGRFTQKRAIESSACFIREEVLEASSRAMFYIEQEIKFIGGTPLWRKTDAIGGMGPPIDIDKYFYDEARTAPMLHWEDPAPPKDERKPREVREPLQLDHFLQYKFFEDASYDGDAEAMATRLVGQKKGCTLCGRPGTGKTTLANAIIDLLEEKGIKYMAFSTTHVSKKKMGLKSHNLGQTRVQIRSIPYTAGGDTSRSSSSQHASKSNTF